MLLRLFFLLWLCLLPVPGSSPAPGLGDAAPLPSPTLTWNYTAAQPDTFVIRRSLDGGVTWQDVATLPGAQGAGLTWKDTTLVVGPVPVVAHYAVYAVKQGLPGEVGVYSEPSNRAIATLGGLPRLPAARVTVVGADSEETTAGPGAARLAGDGLPATLWHTKFSGTGPPAPLPHWITLDLGTAMMVDGLAYLPRQDASRNGMIAQYEVLVSPDNQTWSAPVAQGVWQWGQARLEQYVRWAVVEARYVRLKALKEIAGGPWTSAAEIGLYAAAPAEIPGGTGVNLGTCVLTATGAKSSVITCSQP